MMVSLAQRFIKLAKPDSLTCSALAAFYSRRILDKRNGNVRPSLEVRKRPINKKELSHKEEDIITIKDSDCAIMVHEPKLKVDVTAYVERHELVFDAVLNEYLTNDEA